MPGYWDDFEKNLERNAALAEKVRVVDLPILGKRFIKPRTIAEYAFDERSEEEGGNVTAARNIARRLCDEKGGRLPEDLVARFTTLILRQPEPVLFAISNAANAPPDEAGPKGKPGN